MRIHDITVIHARIPLKKRIRHASHTRTENDTILVRCRLADGTTGWGEGLPRDYVTGETIETAWSHLTSFNYESLAQDVSSIDQLIQLTEQIRFPLQSDQRDCFGNAARCALELALLDAFCRSFNISLSDLIRSIPATEPMRQEIPAVYYSAAITAMLPWKVRLRSWLIRAYAFRACKVKVGVAGTDDKHLVATIRKILGSTITLRLDANEAWKPDEVADRLQQFDGLNIASIEQPVPHAHIGELAKVRRQISIPVMLDESLCSLSDATRAINEELCDVFNIRLSKCGGLLPSLKLARLAHESGLEYQLGCQVGETGILSAAGRHFATSVVGLCALEGSFDRHLVREPLTHENLTFRYGGRGDALNGPGLGVTIDTQAVERVRVRTAEFPVENI